MFGYIRPLKPELKIKDFAAYKAVYCSLCKQLGKSYGFWVRFSLSYDFSFLAMVLLSLKGECPCFETKKCVFNPLKKCTYCNNGKEEIKFTSAASVILLYYKYMDDIKDNGFFSNIYKYPLYPFLKHSFKKAKKDYPELAKVTYDSIKYQTYVEEKECTSIDEASAPSAELLANLMDIASMRFGYKNKDTVTRIGYLLGRWIYLIDAGDDIEKDLKKNGYNVFVLRNGLNTNTPLSEDKIKSTKNEIDQLLFRTLAELSNRLLDLELTEFEDIIKNIIFEGLPEVQRETLLTPKKKESIT